MTLHRIQIFHQKEWPTHFLLLSLDIFSVSWAAFWKETGQQLKRNRGHAGLMQGIKWLYSFTELNLFKAVASFEYYDLCFLLTGLKTDKAVSQVSTIFRQQQKWQKWHIQSSTHCKIFRGICNFLILSPFFSDLGQVTLYKVRVMREQIFRLAV